MKCSGGSGRLPTRVDGACLNKPRQDQDIEVVGVSEAAEGVVFNLRVSNCSDSLRRPPASKQYARKEASLNARKVGRTRVIGGKWRTSGEKDIVPAPIGIEPNTSHITIPDNT